MWPDLRKPVYLPEYVIVSIAPFSSAKSIFFDFLFSSKMQNMTPLLYVHTIIIPGELYKGQ